MYTIINDSAYEYYCRAYTHDRWIHLSPGAQVPFYIHGHHYSSRQPAEEDRKIYFNTTTIKGLVYILPVYGCTVHLTPQRIYITGDTQFAAQKGNITNQEVSLTIYNHTEKNIKLVFNTYNIDVLPGLWKESIHKTDNISLNNQKIFLDNSNITLHVRNNAITYEKDLSATEVNNKDSIFAFITLVGIAIFLFFLCSRYSYYRIL